MKLLWITTVEINYNGISDCMYQYLQAMDKSKMEIDILAVKPSNPEYEKRFLDLGCRVIHLDFRNSNPPLYTIRLAKLIRKQRYDLVHVHGNSATMTFDLLGAKLGGCKVRIAHSHNTSCTHVTEDKILRPLFYHLVTERYACGKAAGEWLYRGRSFTVIPNGRDLKRLTYSRELREKFRRQWNMEEAFVIGHVGSFNEVKNQEFTVDIFQKISEKNPNARLVLMGDGERMDAVKAQCQELGIAERVLFLGNVPNVAELLNAMDLMLLPSRHEGLPLVVMEWQASGLPCVLSDVITRECGLCDLVQYLPLDAGAEEWADVIADTRIPERENACRMGQKALKAAGFDLEENAQNLKEMYQRLIQS